MAPVIRKPGLGRPADERLTAEAIAADPRLAAIEPFDPAQDIDLIGEINAALASLGGELTEDLTGTMSAAIDAALADLDTTPDGLLQSATINAAGHLILTTNAAELDAGQVRDKGVVNVTRSGDALTFTMSDGTTLGPFDVGSSSAGTVNLSTPKHADFTATGGQWYGVPAEQAADLIYGLRFKVKTALTGVSRFSLPLGGTLTRPLRAVLVKLNAAGSAVASKLVSTNSITATPTNGDFVVFDFAAQDMAVNDEFVIGFQRAPGEAASGMALNWYGTYPSADVDNLSLSIRGYTDINYTSGNVGSTLGGYRFSLKVESAADPTKVKNVRGPLDPADLQGFAAAATGTVATKEGNLLTWKPAAAGDVAGPASSTATGLAVYSSGTGKALTTTAITATAAGALQTTGGNARGTGAVDLQPTRGAATRVASGANSTIGGGGDNTASGSYVTIAGGSTNAVSGAYASVGGGASHSVVGQYASVAGGNSVYIDTAATGAAVGGGYNHQVNAQYSTVTGGYYNMVMAAAAYARAGGRYSRARRLGEDVYASGNFSAVGDAQRSTVTALRLTTDATQTELTADGAAPGTGNRITVDTNQTVKFRGDVVARAAGGASDAAWEVVGKIKRDSAGNVTLEASAPAAVGTIPSGWAVTLQADNTNKSLQVLVTGAAATNIRWGCTLQVTELVYA